MALGQRPFEETPMTWVERLFGARFARKRRGGTRRRELSAGGAESARAAGAAGASRADASEQEPDFSPEYGQGAQGKGYAGGAGFEHDEFDFEV